MEHIAMPQLGETVTEGTILRWLKQPGDRIEVDDSLFEVSTEKVDTEVPSAFAGYLRRVDVAEGETVPIGTVLAVITPGADDPLDEAAPPAPTVGPAAGPTAEPDAMVVDPPAPERSAARAPRPGRATDSPDGAILTAAVLRLLAEHGLDPTEVAGSGRGGRITRNDVLAAAANRESSPLAPAAPPATRAADPDRTPLPPAEAGPDDEVVEFTRARRNTAANMLRSIATAAHTLVVTEVDFNALDPVRSGARLSYLPFIGRAVIDALAEFPHLNASVGDDELIVHKRVNLGIAVDVEFQALVVPVVADAGSLRLRALGEAMADLAAKARAKRIGPDQLGGGTFTITNVGAYGTLVTAPIINQPQVAILSTDAVKMRPVAVKLADGTWGIAVHPVGNLCLSFDHRAVDGAYASAFLAQVRDLIETRDWSEEVAP